MPITKSQKEEIVKTLSNNGIILAYLFGSVARGKDGPLSDIDIAVKFSVNFTVDEQEKRANRMAHVLENKLGREVDLKNISNSPSVLKRQILLHGQLLFCKDIDSRVDFAIKTMQENEDMAHYDNLQAREMANRLHCGQYGFCRHLAGYITKYVTE